MKLTLAIAAIFAATTLNAGTMLGCEVKPVAGSNYVVKADPTCEFAVTSTRSKMPSIVDRLLAEEEAAAK